ncbi:hypothetical protein A2U01_0039539, partial [Trifolium medium]|nr:hypothetical protein [Trifolium medium]
WYSYRQCKYHSIAFDSATDAAKILN